MAKKRQEEKKISEKPKISKDAGRLNSILIENFVSLQKAMTNITLKFDSLSDNISRLLQLFEMSAKSFAEKLATSVPEIEKDREFLDKLNKLLDQNKLIAKGLTLMEEKMRERLYGAQKPAMRRFPQAMPSSGPSSGGYIPSSVESEKTKEFE